jgi:hypothetical protein
VVKVSSEVCNGAARLTVAVRGGSIRRAIDLVAGRYPKGDVRVRFLIDPEGFFVTDLAARAGMARAWQPAGIAA